MIDLTCSHVIWAGAFVCVAVFILGFGAYSLKLWTARRRSGPAGAKFNRDWQYLIGPIWIGTEAPEELAGILERLGLQDGRQGIAVRVSKDSSSSEILQEPSQPERFAPRVQILP